MTPRLLNLVDTMVLIAFGLISLGLTIWATATPGNPAIGLVIAWIATAGIIGGVVWALLRKMNALRLVAWKSIPHGISVGCSKPEYLVLPDQFDPAVAALLAKMQTRFPGAADALRGCLVVFHTPSYRQDSTGRTVAGEQDGPIIIVGYRVPLEDSALAHELAHRVIQVCAGDPPEAEAHAIMRGLGVG